jgi:hypothetical protein
MAAVEAMVPMAAEPTAVPVTKADEDTRTIAVISIPAVAAPITPAPMAMAEAAIVDWLSNGSLIAQYVLGGGQRSRRCNVCKQARGSR